MTKQGLTDLERGKYYPGGTNEESTVRVRPDQPIEVSTVDLIHDIENVQSVDLVDEISNLSSFDVIDELTHVTNVDLIDELAHVTNIDSLDLVSEIAHVTNIDSLDLVTEVSHVTNVDLVDELTHVTTVSTVTTVAAVTNITNPIRQSDYSVVPHETYTHALRYLLNAGSPDQNVSGSLAVPVSFSTTATTRSLVHSIDIVIVARNLVSVLDYGVISGGLTNGVQIIRKVGAVETVFFTIKRLVEYAHPSIAGAFQTVSIKSNATEDLIIVSIILKDPVIMQTGDELIIRIRDNLTLATSGIAYQRASVLLKEV